MAPVSQAAPACHKSRKKCAGGRIVSVGAWVDGGATNLGCSDEFVWSPAVCLPVTPKIH